MIYLDASILVSALTHETQSVQVREWLQSLRGQQVHISGWTLLEATCALSRKRRRDDLTEPQYQSTLQLLEAVSSLNWTLVAPVSADFVAARNWVSQAELALRGGDALHLAIAHRISLKLVTLDRGMAKAAAQLGVMFADPVPG